MERPAGLVDIDRAQPWGGADLAQFDREGAAVRRDAMVICQEVVARVRRVTSMRPRGGRAQRLLLEVVCATAAAVDYGGMTTKSDVREILRSALSV